MDPEAQILGTRNAETRFRTILSYIWNFEVLESRKRRKNEPQILGIGPQGGQEQIFDIDFKISEISLKNLPVLVCSSRGSKDWLNGAHFTISIDTENLLSTHSVICILGYVRPLAYVMGAKGTLKTSRIQKWN